MNPIDLNNIAAGRFRFGHDPSAEYEPGGKKDPWYLTIRCRYGEIFPFSSEMLAAHTTGYAARRKIAGIDGARMHNWSDDGEAIFLFPPALFEAVAAIVKPYRRRHLDPKRRAAATDRLRAYHFKPKSTHKNAGNRPVNAPISGRTVVGAGK
jgi:hypothetical protein